MKKVFIITWHYPPEAVGRASRIHAMAKFLKNFHKVKVIAPPPVWPFTKFKKANYLYRNEKIEEVNVLRIWNAQPSKLRPSFLEKIAMAFFFPFLTSFYLIFGSRGVSTIIISAQPTPILQLTLIARILGKKIILDVGDLDYEPKLRKKNEKKYQIIQNFSKKFEVCCWKKSDLIFTNVLGISDKLKKLDNNLGAKVHFLPYNIDTGFFKKLNVKKENQIVYIGNFGPLQNLKPLIESMKIVSAKIPDLKLKLYGGGRCEKELKELVKKLKLEKCCDISDPVARDNIPLILSKSLVGIVPLIMDQSLNYATPTKLFEYLSCELPVFSYSPSVAIEKILTEVRAGVSIKNDKPEEIAQELLKLLGDKKRLENFAENGRNFIENQVDYSQIADLI